MKQLSSTSRSSLSAMLAVIVAIVFVTSFSLNSQAAESEGKEYISVYLSSGEEVIIYVGENRLNGDYTAADIGYVEGISYNLETNTLTINNFLDVNASIGANYVGEDFKIEIVGECHFMCISVYQGCLELSGDGVLVLNEVMDQGTINVISPYEHSGLVIDDSLTLLLFEESAAFKGTGATGFIIEVPSGVVPLEINGALYSNIDVSASWSEAHYSHRYNFDYDTGIGTSKTYYVEDILKGYQLVSTENYYYTGAIEGIDDRMVDYTFSSEENIIYILPAGF